MKKTTTNKAKIIKVKNAEGDLDTQAEVVIQNQIDYTPKVSVIIPVYNVEKYLKKCLDSVVNQTLKEIEIICVDDGSTDNSLKILKQYAKKDKRITVIKQKNLHAGVARNAGLAVAKGEYVHFLDSDDWIDADTYDKLYKIAKKHKCSFVKFKSYSYDEQTHQVVSSYFTDINYMQENTFVSIDEDAQTALRMSDAPWSGIYKLSFLNDNNIRFDNFICANDTGFYYRCLLNSRKFYFVTDRFVYYRINNNKSLIGIRPLNFDCQIKLHKRILQIAKDETLFLKNLLDAHFCHAALWRYKNYMADKHLSKSVKNNIKKLTAEFFSGDVNLECKKAYFSYLIEKKDFNMFMRAYLFFPYYWLKLKMLKYKQQNINTPKVSIIIPIYNAERYLKMKKKNNNQIKIGNKECLKQIKVKNAEGNPDTTAEIVIQNNINYTPKVSVIIPVYNVELYLRECLDSVINQTLKEIEIICVDDGSTDKSFDILLEYAANDNRITVIRQENLHAGVARNAGLAVAKGEYLSFLDSDDFFELNMLEEVYLTAVEKKTDIVMFDVYLYDDATKQDKEVEWTLNVKDVPEIFNYKDIPDKIFKLSNGWACNKLYKQSFINRNHLRFPNFVITEDTCFTCSALVLAKLITCQLKKYYHYRINRSNNTNSTSVKSRIKNYSDVLKSMQKIYMNLNELGCYEKVKNAFLQIVTENIFWSLQTYNNESSIKEKFITYFAQNFKDIFELSSVNFQYKENNKKYTILRNILVDAGVFKEIPKRVFYVWGANEPKREEVLKCMRTWEQFLPDYDIVEINEESTTYFNFQEELKNNKWFRTVYERKMWAYVADYIRMKTLYDNGGIYFDTDVSVVQNMDKFLKEPAFVGIQCSTQDGTGDWVEPAICGAQKGNKFIEKVVSFYDELIWKKPIYTMPQLFNYYLREYDIFPFPKKEKQKIIKLPDLTIYPERYFIPYRFREEYKPECIKKDTHTIHWWGGSWTKPEVIKFLQTKHLNVQQKFKTLIQNNINYTPKVSVIIPVYNVEKYLNKCLDSVISQTLKEIEIICVNDESPDNSLAILRKYAKKDNRITIINQKNQGLSCSRNNALKIAKGEYILFLDSDDWIRNDTCELLYTKSKKYNIDMLNFAGTNYDNDTEIFTQLNTQKIYYTTDNKEYYSKIELEKFMYNIPISACRFFYRRAFLETNQITFPEGINFEDNYFVRKALIFVQIYGVEKEILYFRRVHGESITQNVGKFFGDYIEVIKRVGELYSQNNIDNEITKKIILSYCNFLYSIYSKFRKSEKQIYKDKLFKFFKEMQTIYHISNEKFNPNYNEYKTQLEHWWYQLKKTHLNLDNPKTFNEKIQWLKLYDSTPIKTRLADKYLVRDWVKEKIGEEYLIPLLGVYDKFDDIDFAKLPKQFVIKCNHGSGYNIIVKDKSKLDLPDAKAKIDKWMNENFAFRVGFELHYRDIEPKIIIEKYIDEIGTALYDYRFFCCNGKVRQIWLDIYSGTPNHKRKIYDKNWNELSITVKWPRLETEVEKPCNLNKMIELAEKMSTDFAFVRVDFYDIKNKIYFGEMTFTSMSGTGDFEPAIEGLKLGKLIKLPKLAYNIDTGEYYKLPKKNMFKAYMLFPYYWLKLQSLKKQYYR